MNRIRPWFREKTTNNQPDMSVVFRYEDETRSLDVRLWFSNPSLLLSNTVLGSHRFFLVMLYFSAANFSASKSLDRASTTAARTSHHHCRNHNHNHNNNNNDQVPRCPMTMVACHFESDIAIAWESWHPLWAFLGCWGTWYCQRHGNSMIVSRRHLTTAGAAR